jgi:hypothetical protein
MSEPVSTITIGGIIAGIATGITTALGWLVTALFYIQAAAIFILYATKLILQFAYYLFYSVFGFFLLGVQGIFGNLFYDAEEVMDDLKNEYYVQDPVLAKRGNGLSVTATLEDIVGRLRTILGNLWMNVMVLFAILPGLFVIGISLFILSILVIPFTPLIFITIERSYYFFCLYTNAVAFGLNEALTFLETVAPLWNDGIKAILSILRVLFGWICSGSGNVLSERCPVLYQIDVIFRTTIGFYADLATKSWDFLLTVLGEFGNFLCPNGQCAQELCLKITGNPTCLWSFDDPTFIFQFFLYLFLNLMILAFYSGLLIFAFFSECCFIFATTFALLIRRFITPETYRFINTATRFLIKVSTVVIPANENSQFLEGLKAFEVSVLIGIRVVAYAISNTLNTINSFTNSVFCNFFLGGSACWQWKACVGLFARSICDPLYKPFDCTKTCDTCYYKPFGLDVKTPIFDVARDVAKSAYKNSTSTATPLPYIDDSGYFFTSCDLLSGCCNTRYSITSLIFTILDRAG